MLNRHKSGRTYSLTSYTGVGQAPPNSQAASPAALAAASTVGLNRRRSVSSTVPTPNKRHSIVHEPKSAPGSSHASTDAARNPPQATKTSTKRVVNADRSMSLTTTTVRNLGSFEIVTTKTTPIRGPPARQPKRKGPSGNLAKPTGSASSVRSYESDLDSVLEDSPSVNRQLSPPRSHQHYPKISFSPVTSIDEADDEVVKHTPPPRSLSPSKPALKEHSRRDSLASASQVSFDDPSNSSLHPPRRPHSVSFSDQASESSLSQYNVTPTSSKTSQAHAAATSANKRQSKAMVGNGGSQVRVQANGTQQNTGSPQRKASITEKAAALASKKHLKEPDVRSPNIEAAAAAKRSSLQNANQSNGPAAHHYRTLAYGVGDEHKLSEAALNEHNSSVNGGSKPVETVSDDEDTISMTSESSWKRERDSRPKMGFSMRQFSKEEETVTPKVVEVKEPSALNPITEVGHHPTAATTKPSTRPTSTLVKTRPQSPKPIRSPTPNGAVKPSTVKSATPAATVLKRTPSTSSFERERPQSTQGSAFKMKSLRDQQPQQLQYSSVGDFSEPQQPAQHRTFRSRFADSDSEDEGPVRSSGAAAKSNNRFSLRQEVATPQAHYQGMGVEEQLPEKKRGFFSRSKPSKILDQQHPQHQGYKVQALNEAMHKASYHPSTYTSDLHGDDDDLNSITNANTLANSGSNYNRRVVNPVAAGAARASAKPDGLLTLRAGNNQQHQSDGLLTLRTGHNQHHRSDSDQGAVLGKKKKFRGLRKVFGLS